MIASLAGRVGVALVAVAAVAAAAAALTGLFVTSPLIQAAAGLLAGGLLGWWLPRRVTSPWSRVLRAVSDGIESMRDRDFSISIGNVSDPDLSRLAAAYNILGELLRRERLDLYQRELLLDTVIQTTPLATLLTNSAGQIVFSNISARQLFGSGKKLEGLTLDSLLDTAPAALREALSSEEDRLFTMDVAGEPQVYHLSQRKFHLNSQPHRLVLLKQLTRELATQEVLVWKKVIRVIAHELNNSLAPISSLAHSGRLLASGDHAEQLNRVFTTIADRAAHLTTFIEGYARFAKLPRPRTAPVMWSGFLAGLEDTMAFSTTPPVPDSMVCLDAAQMQQVMINLLKNASESGSPPEQISVAARQQPDGFVIEVSDRGSGLSEEVMRDALLPFYSTKPTGTGLGLTLCREIVDAHGGRLSLANRPGGGAVVTVWLPSA